MPQAPSSSLKNLPAASISDAALRARAALVERGAAMPANPTPPDCRRCAGVGMIYPAAPDGGANYAAAIPCDCQADALARDQTRRLAAYGNLEPLSRYALDNFPNPAAAAAARRYAANPRSDLLITGPPGSGKTHLAAAIANERARQGSPALYIRAAELPELIAAARDRYGQDFIAAAATAPLLAIDGLSPPPSSAWTAERARQIAQRRHDAASPTIYCAESVDDIDPRIAARLAGAERIALDPPAAAPALTAPAPPAYANANIADFDQPANAALLRAAAAARAYAASPRGFLAISGPSGSGKTRLLIATLNAAAASLDAPAAYLTCQKALRDIKASIRDDDSYRAALDAAPILALDQFGEGYASEFDKDALADIIKTRHAYALPTLIAMSAPIESVKTPQGAAMAWRVKSAGAAIYLPPRQNP